MVGPASALRPPSALGITAQCGPLLLSCGDSPMHLQATPGASTDALIVEDDFDVRTILRQLVEDTGDSCSEAEVDLPSAIRGQLLDPAIWQHGLEHYALATNLAVALVGADGSLLGRCLNPQPTWSLLRTKKPAGVGACPFCLVSLQPCSCIADALRRRGLVMARDRTGLVHITVPLVLGGQ